MNSSWDKLPVQSVPSLVVTAVKPAVTASDSCQSLLTLPLGEAIYREPNWPLFKCWHFLKSSCMQIWNCKLALNSTISTCSLDFHSGFNISRCTDCSQSNFAYGPLNQPVNDMTLPWLCLVICSNEDLCWPMFCLPRKPGPISNLYQISPGNDSPENSQRTIIST